MIDLLYLSYHRDEFTEASLAALRANTPAGAYSLFQFDGMSANPVSLMQMYLDHPGSDIFVKLDNDVIVPPGWFEAGLSVMESNPELELLGIEPPLSRTPAPWAGCRRMAAPEFDPVTCSLARLTGAPQYARCECIGGIGFMRRSAFDRRPKMIPHSTYGGFQDWQIRHRVRCGWIVPPLDVFLLDRLPIEPWASLSRKYIAEGSQRAWTNYSPDDSVLWEWWANSQVSTVL